MCCTALAANTGRKNDAKNRHQLGYNFGCMIATDTLFDSRCGFSGSSYPMKTAEIECLRIVAMATNVGTKIVINWLCVNDSDKEIGYGGGLSGRRQNADIADTLRLGDVAMATTFWLSMGYNFGCVVAGNTLFDCRVGFRGEAIR